MITPLINTQDTKEHLAKSIVERIPEHTWSDVKSSLITRIVDQMPSQVLERLTGEPDNFDRADEILDSFYQLPDKAVELMVDAITIIGDEELLFFLDSMQLDKIQPS